MKQRYYWLFLCIGLLLSASAGAQVTGTVTVPTTTYPDLASIITALNTQGVGAGGATIVLTAGFPQTAPAGGYQLGSAVLNASISSSNKLRILGNGNIVTAPVGTSTALDGIFFIKGVDYLTIDNLGLSESAGNTNATTGMEFGYAMVNLNGTSPFDGCQNDTIRNCTITLNRALSTANNGIYSNHHTATSTTLLSPTVTGDLHNNNRFYSNTISNVIRGINLQGNSFATSTTLFDQSNEIGGSSAATGNTFTNCIGASFNGIGAITATYYTNTSVSYNTINNTANGGTPSIGGCWGIYCYGPGATFTVNNNSITTAEASINSGYYQYGIYSNAIGTNMTVTGNTINLTQIAGTGTIAVPCYAVLYANGQTCTVSNNTITESQGLSNASFNYGIYCLPTNTGTCVINANTITQNASTASLGQFYSIAVNTAAGNTVASETITNNIFLNTNLSATGVNGFHMLIYTSNNTGTKTITGNSISGSYQSATTNGFYGIYNNASAAPVAGTVTIANNNLSNVSLTGASSSYGIYCTPVANGPQNFVINGNNINGFNSTAAATLYGIYSALGTTSDIYSNTVGNMSSAGGTVTGIYAGGNVTNNLYRNKVHTLSSSGANGVVHGINLAGGTTNLIYNNTIGSFTTPAATSTTDVIRGINLSSTQAPSTIGLYFNSIYLNASSTGANFSTTGIYQNASTTATTTATDMRNNIVNNSSTPAGTGTTAALRRSASGGTNFASTTNRNVYYAGTPGTSRLILTDGTNSYQTLATYQTAVAPADAVAFTENSPFASVTGSAANFLHFNPISNTIVESSGANVSGITDDYDTDIRQGNTGYTGNGTAPDIGADEFNNCGTIAITTAPKNDTACSASAAHFSIVATNSGLYQWQVNTGSGFTDIADGGVYSGATTSQLTVTNPPSTLDGYTYRVIVRSGPTCTSTTSNTVRLAVTPSPNATVTASGPLTICAGDTVRLSVPLGSSLSYQWKKATVNIPGATSNQLAVDSSGSYTVTVTSTNGCSATSTPQVVVVNPRPASFITYNSPINFCQGSAVVLTASTAANLTYQWYRNDTLLTGATTGFYTAMNTGLYRVVITNATNCNRSSAPLTVIVYPRPNPLITANGLVLSLNGTYAAYQWKLDNSDISGATAPSYTIAANGSYTVRVVDSNGCENISPIYYLGNLGLNGATAAEKGILTYPNPASGRFTIESRSGVKMNGISIYNSIGALVFGIEPQTNKETIVLDSFAGGIYTVKIQTSAGVVTRRLEIVR